MAKLKEDKCYKGRWYYIGDEDPCPQEKKSEAPEAKNNKQDKGGK